MDCVGIILTRAMRSWTPVSDPPWIRKPHGSPPSRITWRLLLLLLVLLVGVSIILERLVAFLIGGLLALRRQLDDMTGWAKRKREQKISRWMFVLLTLILPTAAESSLYNIIHHYLSTSDKLIFYYPSNRPCPATQNVCDSSERCSLVFPPKIAQLWDSFLIGDKFPV
jgi:energy-coupling factor transporter transmembrane protein EcfT